ncbi:hypothetical protein PCIT_b1099 [Pseudoalteromonas citrea]|uniref:N-acetyltransferase domain-containing protein n=2 Tax=Pseudoalteromonas citrea TaxID=43655 RepID=A0AAD4AFH3_9GAMM|nr:GNAT family N-acetyltransferase [Pseudoalteromonas citrea]KAF7764981.1 hypothetical protein PCIT_b1099 [Pseudoalteromonas citrea]
MGNIRVATPEDCINLAALSVLVWFDTYALEGVRSEYSKYALSTFTEAYFLDLLARSNYQCLVCEKDSTLQGFVLVNLESHYENEANGYEVEKLYIHRLHKGQGIGKALLNDVAHRFGDVFWLYTWEESDANSFYTHIGLTLAGRYQFTFSQSEIVNNVYVSYANN